MALRRPHKRMKTAGCRVGFFHRLVGLPLPTPLDSSFRWNDEMGGRNDQGMSRMTNERLPERSIPDRSPGHAFIAIAHPGWGRHTKV